jgi:hypothetical protein
MYLIGATALSDFAAAHPEAGPDLRALAARLGLGGWADAGALAAALGEGARVEGREVALAMPWCGVRVRLAYDAASGILAVREVAPLGPEERGKDR